MDLYSVDGVNPHPWTAAEGSMGKKGGKYHIAFRKQEQLRTYQLAMKDEFPAQNPHARKYDHPLFVTFLFWRQQELSEMVESRNRRAFSADTTNLVKATEDALQGILYDNDRHNVSVRGIIVEQGPEVDPFIIAIVEGVSNVDIQAAAFLRELLRRPSPTGSTSNIRDVDVTDLF